MTFEWKSEASRGDWTSARHAAGIAGVVTLVLVALTLTSDQPVGEGVAAALSNGLLLFFLIVGIEVVTTGRHRIRTVALVAAGATMATVLAVRLVAVAAGAEGPFGSVTDTVVDVATRSAVVFVIVALTGKWTGNERDR